MNRSDGRRARRQALRALACVAAALAPAARGARATSEEARPPNILFIMADDLGYFDVGCYGAKSVKTPNIDRIAREGIRFTDAHSETACCTPTRYGVLTGRYSWRTSLKSGVLGWSAPLLIEKGRLTVPALLKSAGYATACVGKWHLGIGEKQMDWTGELKPGPLEVGFDSYFGMPGDNHGRPVLVENHRLVDPADADRVRRFEDAALRRRKQEEIGPALAAKAVQFVERNTDRPFFLYYTPCAVHTPYTPAKQFQGSSEAGARGDFVQELDWAVGEVLKALDRTGAAARTLIFFASDNGGDAPSSMAPFREHKTSVYEGGHRVPLVARWPGRIKPQSLCDEPVCLSDLMATCAAILNKQLPPDAGEDSFNILPLLLGEKPAAPIRPAMINKACRGPSLSIRQGPWKLLLPKGFWPTAEGVADLQAGKLGKGELYNLAKDPSEKQDLYSQHPELVDKLSQLMIKFVIEGRSRAP
jgi:arylsulfatase A